ncbi:MAG TPA: transcriptional regulator GcvA [Arenibaculum sp.]|nr:transcriptional regulator GcvA [Arenibaculum sp.]
MPIHVPPLQTLRAFETAARHLSYSRAAEELRLTHSAISHHIKMLEGQLGKRLFRRAGHRMELTREGSDLVLKVRQGLRLLERAFEEAVTRPNSTILTVSVLPAFATRWLMPRLPRFHAAFPEIDMDLRTSSELARIGHDGVDLAIRYGPGGWPGLRHEKLMDEYVFPVCSPTYRAGALPKRPEDLRAEILLRNPSQPWEPWFHAACIDLDEPERGPSFSDAALLLQAAAAGQGIALARAALVEDDLHGGRLLRLFEASVRDAYAYYVVWRDDGDKQHAIEAFRSWIIAECSKTKVPDCVAL